LKEAGAEPTQAELAEENMSEEEEVEQQLSEETAELRFCSRVAR
jgi:hypothetical protein